MHQRLSSIYLGKVKYSTTEGFKFLTNEEEILPGELLIVKQGQDNDFFEIHQHSQWKCDIWKSIDAGGEELVVGKEFRIGNTRMKLIHLMNYDQIMEMKR